MTWRQFRGQFVAAAVALIMIAICLAILGTRIRHGYETNLVLCQRQPNSCGSLMAGFREKYVNLLLAIDGLLILLPAVLGIFWGAPLVARELEAGTHRLVWSQSVTRRRWLAVKLLFGGLACMTLVGLVSALLTWAASPYDLVSADRFTALLFGTRNVAPVGYAAFAFALGALLGLLLRRTVPAMALTALIFAVLQITVPTLVRPHLMQPVAVTRPMTAEAFRNLTFLSSDAGIKGLLIPDAWVVATSRLLAPDGRPVDPDRYGRCVLGAPEAAPDCLAALDLHVRVTYHPGDRYWTFQWLECGLFLLLGALLSGFGLWRIQHRRS